MIDVIKIHKGLDLKLIGKPHTTISSLDEDFVSITPDHFIRFIPKMLVAENEAVKVGTPLFCNKNEEQIQVVSPISGVIKEIVRGDKRKITHIIIKSDQQNNGVDIDLPSSLTPDTITDTLLRYGLWVFLSQRPYGIIAQPNSKPKALFISGFDSNPLAPDLSFILQNQFEEFQKGIHILSQLIQAPIYLSLHQKADNSLLSKTENVEIKYFTGPHPAGNVGTQIHFIRPIVSKEEMVWTISLQNVIIIGRLFLHKTLNFSKIVAVTGSSALHPQYYQMKVGMCLQSLIKEQEVNDEQRIINGNVLSGSTIEPSYPYLGFYNQQITIVPNDTHREFLGWLYPGLKRWSLSHTFLSAFIPQKNYKLNTQLHGGKRVMMMPDVYDRVFPFHILPFQLLKACVIKDIELMKDLGIEEVIDEDFALCELVCPSKTECQLIIKEGIEEILNNE